MMTYYHKNMNETNKHDQMSNSFYIIFLNFSILEYYLLGYLTYFRTLIK